MQIIVLGLASQTTRTLLVKAEDLTKDLLSFLTSHQIPVASSCSGQGICKKCVIQNNILSCKLSVADCLQGTLQGKIQLAYL
jgi:Na+-transporting NADH:ubiquinone oxidoreductase subunit NqrF